MVLANAGDAGGETIGAPYELVPRSAYSSSNTNIENAIFGIDRKTPVELFEARNAIRIAKNANATKYAASAIAKADKQLQEAEDAYTHTRDSKTVSSLALDAVQAAEEARVISVKRKAEEDAEAQAEADKRAVEERTAKARADAEAERMKEEAMKAAAEAAKAKEHANRARQAAVADQQGALVQKQAAEAEKADLRAQLLAQLNSILQTNDSARGLIVNLSDILFETGSFTLKPGTREKLAKVSGILLAHPGLTMQMEGRTDSVGGDASNVHLSEQRADSVRDFLGEQGVSLSSISAQGFGKAEPVATNDTREGRQRNRRVEIVVKGGANGTSTTATAGPSN